MPRMTYNIALSSREQTLRSSLREGEGWQRQNRADVVRADHRCLSRIKPDQKVFKSVEYWDESGEKTYPNLFIVARERGRASTKPCFALQTEGQASFWRLRSAFRLRDINLERTHSTLCRDRCFLHVQKDRQSNRLILRISLRTLCTKTSPFITRKTVLQSLAPTLRSGLNGVSIGKISTRLHWLTAHWNFATTRTCHVPKLSGLRSRWIWRIVCRMSTEPRRSLVAVHRMISIRAVHSVLKNILT